ncbi:MAG TPA: cyclopropane fatty acyl phospholipid synthase [bacterium]|nr:cyclopropane fatty acyl phospholipid synthase [bacterium]
MSELNRLQEAGRWERRLKDKVEKILDLADIHIGGKRPWDIWVRDPRWYGRVLSGGSLALGESFMDGWWDCGALDEFFKRIFLAGLDHYGEKGMGAHALRWAARLLNLQSPGRAFQVGIRHYDTGNELFEAMLDERMTYTCGYWGDAKTLEDAQEAKLEQACRKLGLQRGQRVLDIGCGWGSFMKYAAEKYHVQCVGITVSREQLELGRKLCGGLPVEFILQDYRELTGRFDYVVSMGMFEHVGYRNYRAYMEKAHSCLKEGGLFLLSTMGSNRTGRHGYPWFDKYIFPNGMMPSIRQLGTAIEGLFVMEDWSNFGPDYDKTLMAWFSNFEAGWESLSHLYDSRFYRMWKYYLLSLAGAFRARKNQLWQVLLSKDPAGSRRA